MNTRLFLHWLRRDLQRHAIWLLLWLLLVAGFTAERLWVRLHPDTISGYRDPWWDMQATIIGLAELCLLLLVLLDDPARGASAFWKTRPPSGAAVFGAKAVIILFVSLAVPLAADGIFILLAGSSGGAAERLAYYLVPPALAFIAGVAAVNWKRVFVWLPAAVVTLSATAVAVVLASIHGWFEETPDTRVILAAVLLAAGLWAFYCYHRRGKPRDIPVMACVLPALALWGAAGTGWHPGQETSPPPGVDAAQLKVQWHAFVNPRLNSQGRRDDDDEAYTLMLPLTVGGIPDGMTVKSTLRRVTLIAAGTESFSAKCMRIMPSNLQGQRVFNDSDPGFGVDLSASRATALRVHGFDVSGTLRLDFYERKPRAIPLNGTHTIREGGCQWTITHFTEPGPNGARRRGTLWRRIEFISPRSPAGLRPAFIDQFSARLISREDGTQLQVDQFNDDLSLIVWEGVGRREETVKIRNSADEAAKTFLGLAADPAGREDWEFHFDVMTYAGMVELPFTLHVPPS